jgi:hypothetical protein
MDVPRTFGGVATAAMTLLAAAPSALAQGKTFTEHWVCQDVGGPMLEPLGDREGHSIEVTPYSCRVETGPMTGGVATGTNILEWEKTNATMISGAGVARKPGSTFVYKLTDGKLTITITDGKVTGGSAEGHYKVMVGTGDAAPAQGRTTTWVVKVVGPGQFTVDLE